MIFINDVMVNLSLGNETQNVHQKDYEILSGQCEIFAKELLDQARSSEELSTILYYSDESDAISQDGILGK